MDGSILAWLACSACLSFEHALNRVAIAIENISFFIFLKFYTKVIIGGKNRFFPSPFFCVTMNLFTLFHEGALLFEEVGPLPKYLSIYLSLSLKCERSV